MPPPHHTAAVSPSTPPDSPQPSLPLRPFSDRLADAIDAVGSPACVGLDPVLERLPQPILKNTRLTGQADKIEAFCLGVIEAVAGLVPAVKPQAACFERYGAAGQRVLKAVVRTARQRGLIVILDAKRGDIGPTAEHYAASVFGSPDAPVEASFAADALTVNGYMGPDTIEPFLKHPGRGVFVLVRTSNSGSDTVQTLKLSDGRTVAEMMADHVAAIGRDRLGTRGLSDVGAVVAATKPADAASLRAHMPSQIFLVPGFGAQGGSVEDIRPMLRPGAAGPGDLGVLVNSSRAVIYPEKVADQHWKSAIAAAALAFANELKAICP